MTEGSIVNHDDGRIEATIQDLLRQTIPNLPELTPQTGFLTDLSLQSVQVMELIVEVEDHYDIAINLDRLSRVNTIHELAQVVALELQTP